MELRKMSIFIIEYVILNVSLPLIDMNQKLINQKIGWNVWANVGLLKNVFQLFLFFNVFVGWLFIIDYVIIIIMLDYNNFCQSITWLIDDTNNVQIQFWSIKYYFLFG